MELSSIANRVAKNASNRKITMSSSDKEKRELILSKFDVKSYEYGVVRELLDRYLSGEYFTLEQYEEAKDDAHKEGYNEAEDEFSTEIDELKADKEFLNEELNDLRKLTKIKGIDLEKLEDGNNRLKIKLLRDVKEIFIER